MSAVLTVIALGLLLMIAVIDARTGGIPDALSIPFLILSIVRAYFFGFPLLLPMALGSGFFAVQWGVSRGRWVGSGDVLLGAGIGAFLANVPSLILALIIAYVVAALVVIALLAQKKITHKSRLPFAPFLVIGTLVAFLGDDIILSILRL